MSVDDQTTPPSPATERQRFECWMQANLPSVLLEWQGDRYKHSRARQLWRAWHDAQQRLLADNAHMKKTIDSVIAALRAPGDEVLMLGDLAPRIARLRSDAEMARAAVKREAA